MCPLSLYFCYLHMVATAQRQRYKSQSNNESFTRLCHYSTCFSTMTTQKSCNMHTCAIIVHNMANINILPSGLLHFKLLFSCSANYTKLKKSP